MEGNAVAIIRPMAAVMEEYYKNNAKFKRYVDRHCKTYECSVAEALTHALVRQVYWHYLESEETK